MLHDEDDDDLRCSECGMKELECICLSDDDEDYDEDACEDVEAENGDEDGSDLNDEELN